MIFEVGYDVGDGIFSINMIEGNPKAVREEAEKHAEKHGYTVSYIAPIDHCRAETNKAKGMPYKKIESF